MGETFLASLVRLALVCAGYSLIAQLAAGTPPCGEMLDRALGGTLDLLTGTPELIRWGIPGITGDHN